MMGGSIGAATSNRRRNLVIMPEGGEDAGFVHPHGHDRFPDIDRLLLGARGHGPRQAARSQEQQHSRSFHIQYRALLAPWRISERFTNYLQVRRLEWT